jgi:hypothetical protein
VTQIYITSEEEFDSPESKSLDKLITISNENDALQRHRPPPLATAPTMKKVTVTSAKSLHRNRVDVVAEFRKASEEDLRSAKGVRRLRKKVIQVFKQNL